MFKYMNLFVIVQYVPVDLFVTGDNSSDIVLQDVLAAAGRHVCPVFRIFADLPDEGGKTGAVSVREEQARLARYFAKPVDIAGDEGFA